MTNREKECPYEFHLKFFKSSILKATIKNISDKFHAIICENYWHPTRIKIWNKKDIEMKWENVFPPVVPPMAMFLFIKPGQEKVVNEEKICKDENYRLNWAEAQGYSLESGKYKAQVFWGCNYGTKALYNEDSYEESYHIENELDKQWIGSMMSNKIEIELP